MDTEKKTFLQRLKSFVGVWPILVPTLVYMGLIWHFVGEKDMKEALFNLYPGLIEADLFLIVLLIWMFVALALVFATFVIIGLVFGPLVQHFYDKRRLSGLMDEYDDSDSSQ
jgi:F0F1-type ATP synthase assembly protein I